MEKTVIKYPHEDIVKAYLDGEDIEILITDGDTSNWQFYAGLNTSGGFLPHLPGFPIVNKFRVKPKIEYTLPFRRFLYRGSPDKCLTLGMVNKVNPKENHVFEIAEITRIENSKEFVKWIDENWSVCPYLPT